MPNGKKTFARKATMAESEARPLACACKSACNSPRMWRVCDCACARVPSIYLVFVKNSRPHRRPAAFVHFPFQIQSPNNGREPSAADGAGKIGSAKMKINFTLSGLCGGQSMVQRARAVAPALMYGLPELAHVFNSVRCHADIVADILSTLPGVHTVMHTAPHRHIWRGPFEWRMV